MDTAKHDIFISFSFRDQEKTEYIANRLLTEYNIPYWMCTRELVGGDHFKGEIVEAITKSKLVVVIQSENSIASKEVPKEVAVALEKNKPVIPFVLDDAELSGDLEYDLIGIHRVDGRKPTLDERIEDLAMQIYGMINKTAEKSSPWAERFLHTRIRSTATVIPKKVFCGREGTLSQMDAYFKSGERVLFLYGIGGIGKTQIAKQYVKKHSEDYDTVVFATYSGSLCEMVAGESPFTLEPELQKFVMPDGTQESDKDFFKRKIEKIKRISDERTLIVIDNFDVDDDEGLELLLEGRYHILITTRVDFSKFYPTIRIEEIESMDDLIRVFMENYGGYEVEEDDGDLPELIELVNRHTYTIELLAQHMENSGQTPKEMIEALKKEGIMSLSEEIRTPDMQKHTAYENLLKMFRLFTLNREEKEILMYLTFMPIDGINVRNFRFWAQLDSCNIIKNLENKSWIIKNTEGIALHPIIRQVIKQEITATWDNCGGFIKRFTESIDDKKMWAATRAEKSRYAQIAGEVIKSFPEITKETEDLYYYAQTVISFSGGFKLAEKLAQKLYDYHLKTYGKDSFKAARAAFKCGWIYSFNGFANGTEELSEKWMKMADEIFENAVMTTSDEMSRHTMTKTTLSKIYNFKYEKTGEKEYYEKAKSYAESAIRHARENFVKGDYHYAKIAGAEMELVGILLKGNETDAALEVAEDAILVLTELFNDENHADMGLAYYSKAAALYAMNKFEQVIEYAEKSDMLYEKFFGERFIKRYATNVLSGDAYMKINNGEKAIDAYNKALEVAEAVYGPNSLKVKEVREKIECVLTAQ